MSLISKAQVECRLKASGQPPLRPDSQRFWVYLGVRTCDIFSVSLVRAGVWLLFNGLLALLFSLFYVMREFDRFLH